MSFVFNRNPTLDNQLSEELMPEGIRLLTLEHCHKMLVYILRRPDNDFKADNVECLLRSARRCRPEFINEFYQNFSALAQAILHYMRLEESCTMSGKYRKDLDIARDKLGRILNQLEGTEDASDKRFLRYMAGMIG